MHTQYWILAFSEERTERLYFDTIEEMYREVDVIYEACGRLGKHLKQSLSVTDLAGRGENEVLISIGVSLFPLSDTVIYWGAYNAYRSLEVGSIVEIIDPLGLVQSAMAKSNCVVDGFDFIAEAFNVSDLSRRLKSKVHYNNLKRVLGKTDSQFEQRKTQC